MHLGLDSAYCPDCKRNFWPSSKEYTVLLNEASAAIVAQALAKESSGVVSTEATPEPKTVVSAVHWVEVYPVKQGAHHYYRYRWLDDPSNIRSGGHLHIKGGNIRSDLAIARKQQVEAAIQMGKSPSEIVDMMKPWIITHE